MTLVRWDPFREMAALSDRLNRVLSDNPAFARTNETYGAWMPPVDIFERNDQLVLRAELPGMNRDDIDLRVENGLRTLYGERRREQGFDEDGVLEIVLPKTEASKPKKVRIEAA